MIDGDTVVADIDLGFRVWLRDEHLRLFGIDAPENGTEAGHAVTEALRERIGGRTLYICTTKAKHSDTEAKGSFGRYLVTIFDDGLNLNEWLLESGRAVPFE
ncbi:thermonuclease family protein [Chachezhania sediminis]|uniref:thermonuclease family protein n=1 Tax=Chachezhania sediminis TaxID=2599291 RepID=UPI00131A8AD5|nr:thermonuclease family protein [Chachezhania sediminis]